MDEIDKLANRIQNETFWRRIKLTSFRNACELLKTRFDIVPSLSDKGFILRYITEYYNEQREIRFSERYEADPMLEAIAKYLMIHYNFRDVGLIRKILYNKDDISINKKLREYRLQFESNT